MESSIQWVLPWKPVSGWVMVWADSFLVPPSVPGSKAPVLRAVQPSFSCPWAVVPVWKGDCSNTEDQTNRHWAYCFAHSSLPGMSHLNCHHWRWKVMEIMICSSLWKLTGPSPGVPLVWIFLPPYCFSPAIDQHCVCMYLLISMRSSSLTQYSCQPKCAIVLWASLMVLVEKNLFIQGLYSLIVKLLLFNNSWNLCHWKNFCEKDKKGPGFHLACQPFLWLQLAKRKITRNK